MRWQKTKDPAVNLLGNHDGRLGDLQTSPGDTRPHWHREPKVCVILTLQTTPRPLRETIPLFAVLDVLPFDSLRCFPRDERAVPADTASRSHFFTELVSIDISRGPTSNRAMTRDNKADKLIVCEIISGRSHASQMIDEP